MAAVEQLYPDQAPEGEPASGTAKQQGFTIADLPGHKNIAELLDEDRLTTIGTLVWDEYEIDKKSRADKEAEWDAAAEAFNLKGETKTFPFDKAANVKFPTLLVAAIQFAARAMPAVVHDGKVAKGKVIGKEYEAAPPPPPPMMPGMEGGPPSPDMPPDQMPGASPLDPGLAPPGGGLALPPGGAPSGMEGMPPAPPQRSKQDQADRISGYLNYQLLDKDTSWVTEQDQMLHQLPVFGTAIKKIFRDPVYGNKSELVSVRDFIVNAAYPSLERAPRYTQRFDLYPNEVEERKRDGRFLDIELTNTPTQKTDDKKGDGETPPAEDKSAPHELLEQHRLLDLDEDNYHEPYCVTLHVSTKKVVRITASYDARDIILKDDGSETVVRVARRPYFVKYGFIPDPEGGFYDIGFGKLLLHPVEVINTIINQLINAGTLATAGGGFIGKELRLKSGEIRVSPGKYPLVPYSGDDIRKAMYHHQFPEPSPVLFQLLGFLVEQTDRIISSPEVLTGEAPANQPATTTLALIEQGLKVFTGIVGRVLRALGGELKVMYDLNARYMAEDEKEYFNYGDDEQYVMGSDFDPASADVVPVADATVVTDMQKMARAEMVMGAMAQYPTLHNPLEALKRFYEAAGIPTPSLLVEQMPPPQMEPKDELASKKFGEIEKPQAELDGALKQIELFQAMSALPPEIQQLMGIENPISNPEQEMAQEDRKQKAEAHGVDMESKRKQNGFADEEMNMKRETHQREGEAAAREAAPPPDNSQDLQALGETIVKAIAQGNEQLGQMILQGNQQIVQAITSDGQRQMMQALTAPKRVSRQADGSYTSEVMPSPEMPQ